MRLRVLVGRLVFSTLVSIGILALVWWLFPIETDVRQGASAETQQVVSSTQPLPPIEARNDLGMLGYDSSATMMVASVMTGTSVSVWSFHNPNGLTTIHDYHSATFDQQVLSQDSTSALVELTGRAFFSTQAAYPLNASALPSGVRQYLYPTPSQQSDNPAIRAQAQALIGVAQTEVQAVVAILDWVRANIVYDYSLSLPTDAVSVYQNRSGVCDGFSNLSVALLRAVGIPARKHIGCALWTWFGGDSGLHAWIEVYYPDAGWVPSEPQGEENFLYTQYLFHTTDSWCGSADTTYTQVSGYYDYTDLYSLRTPYAMPAWSQVQIAATDPPFRLPLESQPTQPTVMVCPGDSAEKSAHLQVSNNHPSTHWWVEDNSSWLSATPTESYLDQTSVSVLVDTTGLGTGTHTGMLTLTTAWHEWDSSVYSMTISVRVIVADTCHHSYLPVVLKSP